MRKINYILSIIFSISISFLNIHASEKCEYKVKKLHNALLGNSQSEQNFKENFLKLRDINSVIFDSKKMIRIIYGRKWKKLEENQKEELQLKFLDFLTYNYVKRFRNMNEAYFTEKKIENIELVEGNVLDTLPEYLIANPHLKISLLHLDMDVMEPTAFALEHLYDRVVKGGMIMIDDYPSVGGAVKAVDTFLEKHDLTISKLPYYSVPSFILKP